VGVERVVLSPRQSSHGGRAGRTHLDLPQLPGPRDQRGQLPGWLGADPLGMSYLIDLHTAI
jgi:hypothetical protein